VGDTVRRPVARRRIQRSTTSPLGERGPVRLQLGGAGLDVECPITSLRYSASYVFSGQSRANGAWPQNGNPLPLRSTHRSTRSMRSGDILRISSGSGRPLLLRVAVGCRSQDHRAYHSAPDEAYRILPRRAKVAGLLPPANRQRQAPVKSVLARPRRDQSRSRATEPRCWPALFRGQVPKRLSHAERHDDPGTWLPRDRCRCRSLRSSQCGYAVRDGLDRCRR
jgi:hypothetical protein